MGMSASQARLLTLTARLSDLEYSAQNISNTKIRLADQTEDAATAYSEALNQQMLTVYDGDTNSYIEATAFNLSTYDAISSTDNQRILVNNAGQIGVPKAVAEAFNWAADPNNTATSSYVFRNTRDESTGQPLYFDEYGPDALGNTVLLESGFEKALKANVTDKDGNHTYPDGKYDQRQVTYYTNLWNGSEDFMASLNPDYTSDPEPFDQNGNQVAIYDGAMSQYYTNLFIEMQAHGYFIIDGQNMNDSEWLYNQLNNGSVYIKTWDHDGGEDGTGAFVEGPWQSGDKSLKVQDNDSVIAKAEADYDTAMARIHSKEAKLDLQLKQIDTEHNAVQTEVDSVKKVIDKNIERTFKMFDA